MLALIFLFLSFYQLGLFGFGGNAASMSILEHETVTLHHWFTPEQLADLMTLCRALPGGTGVNAATLSGYVASGGKLGFWPTAGFCSVGVIALCLAAVTWTFIVSRLNNNELTRNVLDCVLVLLRPLVPGLIAAAAWMMMTEGNFGSLSTSPWHFWTSVFLAVSAFVGIKIYRINATFMVVLCGIAGVVLF